MKISFVSIKSDIIGIVIPSTDRQQHQHIRQTPGVRVLLAVTMSYVRSLLVGGTQTGHSYRLVTCDLCLLACLLSGPLKVIVGYINLIIVLADDVVVVVAVGWPRPLLAPPQG